MNTADGSSWSTATLADNADISSPRTSSLHTTSHNEADTKPHPQAHPHPDDPNMEHFPRISRPVELLRNSYDVVVVGSGYGGGVAASRMARAGQSVCLLERGKERWPGEYPSTLLPFMRNLHVSGASKLVNWATQQDYTISLLAKDKAHLWEMVWVGQVF